MSGTYRPIDGEHARPRLRGPRSATAALGAAFLIAVVLASGVAVGLAAHGPAPAAGLAVRPPSAVAAWLWNQTNATALKSPHGVDFIPAFDTAYVTSSASAAVTRYVFGPSAVTLSEIPVPNGPIALGYDSVDNATFVAQSAGASVAVIYGGSDIVGATVAVQQDPSALAYQPLYDRMLVTNQASGTVSMINASTLTVVANFPVGTAPDAIVYDATDEYAFVANSGADTVSVINLAHLVVREDGVIATLPVGTGPDALTIDTLSDELFVANGVSGNLSVFYASNATEAASVPCCTSTVPTALAFASNLDSVLVITSTNTLLQVISATTYATTQTIALGTGPGMLAYNPGTSTAFVPNDFVGGILTLLTRVAGYTVTFNETGLPTGTKWEVYVPFTYGTPVSSTTTSISVLAQNGTTKYAVGEVAGWATNATGRFTVNGGSVSVALAFHVATAVVTFSETGLPNGAAWYVNVSGQPGLSTTVGNGTGTTLTIGLANGTYAYGVATNGKNWSTRARGSVTLSGVSETVSLTFAIHPYVITLAESGLPNGARWYVNVTGQPGVGPTTVSGVHGTELTISLANGTYSYTATSEENNWTGVAATFAVAGVAETVPVRFVPNGYFITFSASGLPSGLSWSVLLDLSSQSTTGAKIQFIEPNGSYLFIVQAPTGYLANGIQPYVGSVVVMGQNQSVAITFSANSSGSATTTTYAVNWVVVGPLIAAIAAVIGVGLYLWTQRRRAPPPRPPAARAPSPAGARPRPAAPPPAAVPARPKPAPPPAAAPPAPKPRRDVVADEDADYEVYGGQPPP